MPPSKDVTEAKPGSFAAFLASTRPKTDAELYEEYVKLVAAVEETGKADSLQLTVTIKPFDGGGSTVIINDQIKAKRPERNREGVLRRPQDVLDGAFADIVSEIRDGKKVIVKDADGNDTDEVHYEHSGIEQPIYFGQP